MINKYSFLKNGDVNSNNIVTQASIFLGVDIIPFLENNAENLNYFLSFAKFSQNGELLDFQPYDGNYFYERNLDNNNFIINNTPYITGYTIVKKLDRILSSEEKNDFNQNFIQDNPFGQNIKFGVKFEEVPINDMFVNISLVRDYDFLDTLSIKNNLQGEWPTSSSNTGVVFGKLLAVQKIKDENDEFIKIPLRNVPIIILNKESELVSLNPQQNINARIPLNCQENSNRDLYFDDFSYNFDKKILPNIDSKNVGETYKYSTLTNENGEFIIPDVPIGLQTLIFEIDLLKQGLTLDEIDLNISPIPKTNELSFSESPHLIYREIPINVLTSWGDPLNFGYTRVNVDINVDLRKWVTYFLPPITFFKKEYQELLQSGFQPGFKIKVRDMALKNKENNALYSNQNTECVVIQDIKNRNSKISLGWFNEIRQIREIIFFNNLEYNAFKLPSNIYDPNGFKRNGDGSFKLDSISNKPNQKGVWLSSYQFKIFTINENLNYRETGFLSDVGKATSFTGLTNNKSHYALNTNLELFEKINLNDENINGVGLFPYEKPWGVNYPSPYSIPEVPKNKNNNKIFINGEIPENNIIPRFLDGDLVGYNSGENTYSLNDIIFGGWGAQSNVVRSVFSNKFSQQVTTSPLYRYEINGSFSEEYSNGYTPNNGYPNLPPEQRSLVKNGELYQRLESGHAYFIWIQGFPRIWNKKDNDEMLPSDYLNTNVPQISSSSVDSIPYISSYKDLNSLFFNDTLLTNNLDANSKISVGSNILNNGYAYFYRITNPDPTKLIPSEPPFISKFIKINLQNTFIQRGEKERIKAVMATDNSPKGDKSKFYNFFDAKQSTKDNLKFVIVNRGEVSVKITNPIDNSAKTLKPGEKIEFNLFKVYQSTIQLPTNTEFDAVKNTYNSASYDFEFKDVKIIDTKNRLVREFNVTKSGNRGEEFFEQIVNFKGETQFDTIPELFLTTKIFNVRVRGTFKKFKPDGNAFRHRSSLVIVDGAVFLADSEAEVRFYVFETDKARSGGGDISTQPDDLPYKILVR
jgi:hypothetical protein